MSLNRKQSQHLTLLIGFVLMSGATLFSDELDQVEKTIPNHFIPKPLSFDLGYISPNGVQEITVPIENPLDSWIWIKKVVAECPCIQILDSDKEFKPFETGNIRIKFKAPDKPVNYTKQIHLITSHPQYEHIPITLTARVGIPLKLETSNIDLGSLTVGQPVKFRVPIINDGEETVRLAYGVSDDRALVPRLEDRRLAPGETTDLVINLDSDLILAGDQEAHITVYTNCKAQKTLQLTVRYKLNDE